MPGKKKTRLGRTTKIAKSNTVLVQTKVAPDVYAKLKKLSRATSRSNAGYLRALLNAHVNAIDPKVAQVLARAWDGLGGDDDFLQRPEK